MEDQGGLPEVDGAYRLGGQGEMIWLQNSETDIKLVPRDGRVSITWGCSHIARGPTDSCEIGVGGGVSGS